MEQSDLLKRLTSTFEALGIPYLITGSVASTVYGEPRFTNDIDVIAAISLIAQTSAGTSPGASTRSRSAPAAAS